MIYTEIRFYNYKTDRYVAKAFKGDFLEAIKNRVAKRKTKYSLQSASTYSLKDFATINTFNF
jgi:hypothetical protein